MKMSKDREVIVSFTEEEALELLSCCLNSQEADTDASREAICKLASALKASRRKLRIA